MLAPHPDDFDAAWKGQLLRFHRSQQERNLRLRGIGFDARVLQVNRQAAKALGPPLPYAEVFEFMQGSDLFGGPPGRLVVPPQQRPRKGAGRAP